MPGSQPSSPTPLMLACTGGRLHQVEALLDDGANIDERAKDGSFALLKAIETEHADIAQLLIKRGAKLSLPLKLLSAIKLEASDAVELALERGIDIFGICGDSHVLSDVLLQGIGERFLMHSAGEALHEAMAVVDAARRAWATVDYALGSTAAAEVTVIGEQAEALAIACVEMLDRECISKVLSSSIGCATLRRAILSNSKRFIDSSRVHYCLQSQWLGPHMQRVFYPPVDERAPLMRICEFSKLVLILACNVLFLPVVAMYPPLEQYVPRHRSWLARYYLLDVPIFKLVITTADHIVLAWLLTWGLQSRLEVREGSPRRHHVARGCSGAVDAGVGAAIGHPPRTGSLTSLCHASHASHLRAHLLAPPRFGLHAPAQSHWRAAPMQVYLLTYWTFMSTAIAVVEASSDSKSWLSDPFNTFESISIALTFVALFFTIYDGVDVRTAFQVLLTAIPLLWLAVGLRVLALTPTIGRLVVVIGRMFSDVLSWSIVYLVFVTAFAASFTRSVHTPEGIDSFDAAIHLSSIYFLGRSSQDDIALRKVVASIRSVNSDSNATEMHDGLEDYVDNVAGSCQDFYVDMVIGGPSQTFFNAVSLLFQSSIQTADAPGYSSCLAYLAIAGSNSVGVWMFLSFLFLSAVVLVNMLIAQMSKTFDDVWENGRADQRHARARLLVALEARQSALPAPLCVGWLVRVVAARLVQLLVRSGTLRAGGRVAEVAMQHLGNAAAREGDTARERLQGSSPPENRATVHLNPRAQRLRAASVSKSVSGLAQSELETDSLELEAGLIQLASIVAANTSFEPPPQFNNDHHTAARERASRVRRAPSVVTGDAAESSGDSGDNVQLATLSIKVGAIEQTLAEVSAAVQQLLKLEHSRDLSRAQHAAI